jgi:hypothetical protein
MQVALHDLVRGLESNGRTLMELSGAQPQLGTPAMSESKQAVKCTLVSDVPAKVLMQWLQHVRDFDTANPGCRFEVMIEAADKLTGEMIEKLRAINPELSIEKWGLK